MWNRETRRRRRRRRRGGKKSQDGRKQEIKDMSTVAWEKKLQRDKVKQQEKVKKDRDTPGSLHLCLMSALCRNIFFLSSFTCLSSPFPFTVAPRIGDCCVLLLHAFFVVVVVVDFVSYLCFSASHSPLPSVLCFLPLHPHTYCCQLL